MSTGIIGWLAFAWSLSAPSPDEPQSTAPAPTETAPEDDPVPPEAGPAEALPEGGEASADEPVEPTPPAEASPDAESPADPVADPSVDDASASPDEPGLAASATIEPEPAATARVRGRILTFGDREPISSALIILASVDAPIVSENDGSFAMRLPPGKYEGVVRAPGFLDLPTSFTLGDNEDLELEYYLDKDPEGRTYRTVVQEDRQRAISSHRLRDAEIREVPGTLGDPLRVVNSLPGVSQLAGFLPYVVVRGAAPGNTGYYLDGVRVPLLFHVAIGPSVIHPYFIDSVDFYPSGAPVRLGRYASGMIEARTRPGSRDKVHGDVDLRLTDTGALVEIPLSRPVEKGCTKRRKDCKKGRARGSLTLAGRYSYTAAILSIVQSQARIQYWDYQARFDHRLGRRLNYTAFAYGSYDDIGSKTPDPETGREVTFLRFNFHRLDNRIRHSLPGGGTGTYALALGLDTTALEGLRTNEYRVAPRFDFVFPTRREGVSIGVGIDQELQFFRLDQQESSGNDFSAEDLGLLFGDRFVSATGLYLDVPIQKGIVEARPGIRADVYAQFGASPYLPSARSTTTAAGVDPRLSLRETVAPRWALRQSVGLYHQPPSFPIPVPGIESFGFERGLQRNLQGSFGYEYELLEGRLRLEQEVYVGWLTNLQDYELAEEVENDPVNEIEDIISQVSGWAYGIETLVRIDPRLRVFGWAAYTLSRATRNFPVGGRAAANWDQRHILNVVLGYRISDKWKVGARGHYHTGRPWTAPVDDQTNQEALALNRNNARLPPFFQLDVRVDRTWRWPRWQLMAYLEVVNATYSNEVFQCSAEGALSDTPIARQFVLSAPADPSRGLARCTPAGFRYTIPMLGLRGRW